MSEYCLRSDILLLMRFKVVKKALEFSLIVSVVRGFGFEVLVLYRELRMSRGLYLQSGPSGDQMEYGIRPILGTGSKIREWSDLACSRLGVVILT